MDSLAAAIAHEIDMEILSDLDKREANLKRVADTWEEIGWRARPLRDMVFVRTELRPERDGLIWLLPKERSNYGGLANTAFMRGLILSVGPDCKFLKTGDRIAFTRLFFARWAYMQDGTLVGWIRADNIQAEDLMEYDYSSTSSVNG